MNKKCIKCNRFSDKYCFLKCPTLDKYKDENKSLTTCSSCRIYSSRKHKKIMLSDMEIKHSVIKKTPGYNNISRIVIINPCKKELDDLDKSYLEKNNISKEEYLCNGACVFCGNTKNKFKCIFFKDNKPYYKNNKISISCHKCINTYNLHKLKYFNKCIKCNIRKKYKRDECKLCYKPHSCRVVEEPINVIPRPPVILYN